MTKYLFGFLVDQITEGARGNKYVIATWVVNDQFDMGTSETHVYKHIRSWSAKSTRICRLKNM